MQLTSEKDDVHCWAVGNSGLSLSFDEGLSQSIRCLCDARERIGKLDRGGKLEPEEGGRSSLGGSC